MKKNYKIISICVLIFILLIVFSTCINFSYKSFKSYKDYSVYEDTKLHFYEFNFSEEDIYYTIDYKGNEAIIDVNNYGNDSLDIFFKVVNSNYVNLSFIINVYSDNKDVKVSLDDNHIPIFFYDYEDRTIHVSNIKNLSRFKLYVTLAIDEYDIELDYDKERLESVKDYSCGKSDKLYDMVCNLSLEKEKNNILEFNNLYAPYDGVYVHDENNTKYFYYRGDVDNNVIFADMCFKIVRTTENKGTLLIYNGEANYGKCYNEKEDSVIAVTNYNNYSNFNAYIGYMYSETYTGQYEFAHGNKIDSNVKIIIDKWYKRKLYDTDYEKLIDYNNVWCNDRSVNYPHYINLFNDWKDFTNYGYDQKSTIYSAFNRVGYHSVLYFPKLRCNLDDDSFGVLSGNKKLTYPVGLLSLDEVIMAGSIADNKYKIYDTNNYLKSGIAYWTMTPAYFAYHTANYYGAYVGSVNSNGFMYHANVTDKIGVRPTIALTNKAVIKSGDGTRETPFIIG